MYRRILMALENSEADKSLIPHVAELACQLHSELLLVHVADGWVARNYDHLKLAESAEMREDTQYLEKIAQQLKSKGLTVGTHLALGNPPEEILKTADTKDCDLIAMTSHGHRWLADLILGSTIHVVRHKTSIPILLVRAGTAPATK